MNRIGKPHLRVWSSTSLPVLLGVSGIAAQCNPDPAPTCGAAPCSPAETRYCVDRCGVPAGAGETCAPDPCDESAPPCADGLSCVREDSTSQKRICKDLARTLLSPCNAAATAFGTEACTVGTFCMSGFCPGGLPNQPDQDYCVATRNEGSACDSNFGELGCAQCDPGLACSDDRTTQDQRCRRECNTPADCPCGDFACMSPGLCVKCRHENASCGNAENPSSGECCDQGTECRTTIAGDPTTTCCRAEGAACTGSSTCCEGATCDASHTCTKTPSFAGSLDTSCNWGDPSCQRCVMDVRQSFRALATSSRTTFDINLWPGRVALPSFSPSFEPVPTDPPPPSAAHFQGMARFSFPAPMDPVWPSYSGERWLVLSKSGSDTIDSTGLYFVYMSHATTGGGAWSFSGGDPWEGYTETYYNIFEPGLDHASPLQMYGSLLAETLLQISTRSEMAQVATWI